MKRFMENRYVKAILAALVAILVFLCILLLRQYLLLRRAEFVNFRHPWFTNMRTEPPLSAQDAANIQPWMTFDYVNRIFGLAPSVLQSGLQIADPHYPRISIMRYAAHEGIDGTTFLNEVKNAVRNATAKTP